METLLNEGTGGDGADVTFIKAGDADPTQDAAGMTMIESQTHKSGSVTAP